MIDIYKASAGAGKTHKLTGEYIRLLFSQPHAFKHVLAVTFTNKATDEMKQRILQELYTLSCKGQESDYLQEIMDFTSKDEARVREEAHRILVDILHDYSSFWVSTIDKFFQLVMRSFARELGKMATYNVELDRDSVLAKAVDRMFSDLDEPENAKLLEWLISYSLDAVEKGDSWNVKGEIIKLGGQLFSEEFKLLREQCHVQDADGVDEVAALKARLQGLVKQFEDGARAIGKMALEVMGQQGLAPEDFKGGKNSPMNYFRKLAEFHGKAPIEGPKPTFVNLEGDMDRWFTGKRVPPAIEAAYPLLNGLVGKVVALMDGPYRQYMTAHAVLGNVNVLGILNDIHVRVLDYCREKNIILLSESTELLNRIIDDSDTPFVYEKIGARIDNFMLDEFQDTSSLQWRNFRPLLRNSLAEGHDNLVVGDVKQSIYRWRGSDWNILNRDIYHEFRPEEVRDETLSHNWRSRANIVEFNNDFFDYCAKAAQQLYGAGSVITDIYSGFRQEIPQKMRKDPGYVEVDFVESDGDGFEENALELLPARIAELLAAGYRQKDIAILIRKGKEGNLIAEKLLSAGYDIISSDSLYVGSSAAVQKILNILREFDNPQSESLAILRKYLDIPQVDDLKRLSLYQMCEVIARDVLSPQERRDVAFLQAFLDLVLDFTNKEGTNISQFLKWWDESGVRCTISAPDDMDAIRIMTIHKSKGLGFNVVIIPFLREKLDHLPSMAPTLWCSYENRPVPVRYGKALENTDFSEAYQQERLSSYVDALNTVYVAFTRPKKELVVFAAKPKANKKGDYPAPASVSEILFAYGEKLRLEKAAANGAQAAGTVQPAADRFCIGEHCAPEPDNSKEEKLVMEKVFDTPIDEMRVRTAAVSGTIGEGESIREHGIAMHYVFSLIDYPNSVEAAVKKACSDGVADCPQEELLEMVRKKLDSVGEYGWFSPEWEVKNECSIITEDGEEFRPDRVIVKDGTAVVVDYKFGGLPHADTRRHMKYLKQVDRYMELIRKMGYRDVKGYLWYLSADTVVPVCPPFR